MNGVNLTPTHKHLGYTHDPAQANQSSLPPWFRYEHVSKASPLRVNAGPIGQGHFLWTLLSRLVGYKPELLVGILVTSQSVSAENKINTKEGKAI